MFLIFDTAINRHVGQTNENFDVSQLCGTFELREESEQGLADFQAYKQQLADLAPAQPQAEDQQESAIQETTQDPAPLQDPQADPETVAQE